MKIWIKPGEGTPVVTMYQGLSNEFKKYVGKTYVIDLRKMKVKEVKQ